MPSKKTTFLICSAMLLSVFILYPGNAAGILEVRPVISENSYSIENLSFGDNQSSPFTLKTDGNISVWFLTPIEFAAILLANGSISHPVGPADLNSIINGTLSNGEYTIVQPWTMTFLNETYGLPIMQMVGEKITYSIPFYMVVLNHGPGEHRVFLQLKPVIALWYHLNISTKWMIVFLMSALVVWLLWTGYGYTKSPDLKHKAKMYYGFGVGFGFGLAARLLGEFNHYYDRDVGLYLYPQERLQGNIASLLLGGGANTAIPSVLLITMLTLAFVGFSFIVEKIVKNRKPILTANLIVAAAVVPFLLVFPELTDIIITYVIISIVLAVVNIIIVYLVVAKNTSGMIRKQAIFTLIGVIVPIVFQLFGSALKLGTFPNSADIQGILYNSIVVFGLLLFYKSKV
jgi:hypothetical protein